MSNKNKATAAKATSKVNAFLWVLLFTLTVLLFNAPMAQAQPKPLIDYYCYEKSSTLPEGFYSCAENEEDQVYPEETEAWISIEAVGRYGFGPPYDIVYSSSAGAASLLLLHLQHRV